MIPIPNIISYIIIICLVIYMIYTKKNISEVCTFLVLLIFFYYFYIWKQKFNVYPSKNYKLKHNYKHKFLWINTNVININNTKHKDWCMYVLIDSAPNKLGIYIDHPNPEKVFVNRQIETFKIMFGYIPKDIYFTTFVNSSISSFCKLKNIKITYFPWRYIVQ